MGSRISKTIKSFGICSTETTTLRSRQRPPLNQRRAARVDLPLRRLAQRRQPSNQTSDQTRIWAPGSNQSARKQEHVDPEHLNKEAMTLAEATAAFLDSIRQTPSTATPQLQSHAHQQATRLLSLYYSADSALNDLCATSLRDFLARWYL